MIAIASLALLAGLASCQKEGTGKETAKQTEEVEIVPLNLTASFLKTRVSYAETDANNLKPSWEEGDEIFCTADGGTFYKLTVDEVYPDGSASISGEGPGNGTVALLYRNGLNSAPSLPLGISYDGQSEDKTMPNVLFASGTITDGTGTFEFTSAGSVVGVSYAKSLAGKTIKSVKIEGKNLSGAQVTYASNAFTLTATQNDSDAITTADLTSKNITVKSNGEFSAPVFIAVPAGATISKVTVTSTDDVTDTKDLSSSPKTVEANQYLYVKVPAAPEAPDGAIANGRFTINSNGDQVFFSKGNLKYDKGTDWTDGTWCFFDNQYDCDPGTNDTYAADYISLFSWGYNATNSINPEDISCENSSVTNNGDPFLKTEDWGSQVGDEKTWRTLTTAEWQYLFDSDKRQGMYAYGVTVCGSANCVVLYPDGYSGTKVTNGNTTSYDTEEEYLAATAEGVVFLPAAGFRDGSTVGYVGSDGFYWSSTAYAEYDAYRLGFDSGYVSPNSNYDRYRGCSVRLVSDCN